MKIRLGAAILISVIATTSTSVLAEGARASGPVVSADASSNTLGTATGLATAEAAYPVVGMSFAQQACAYKPSELIGNAGTAITAVSSGAVGGAGAVGWGAKLYALTHAVTGATMLGSAAGGASAAGTVGIMGGTAGYGAVAIGVVANPLVWIPAAAAAVGIAAYEGGCYFVKDPLEDDGLVSE